MKADSLRLTRKFLSAVLFFTVNFSSVSLIPEEITGDLPGKREIEALALAYPGRITKTAVRNGEWALYMDGRWFYWSSGRLLTAEHRDRWEQFIPVRFYTYDFGPYREREISPELAERLRVRSDTSIIDSRLRFNEFLDVLYGITSRPEADQLMMRVSFLGYMVRIHPLLDEPLQRVEARILKSMRKDRNVEDFVEGLLRITGYNWRNIAGTLRRSYHSYGIAIDLIPVHYGNGFAYWRWALEAGVTEWWNLKQEDRWEVPPQIVDAFESEGFIWGGKWLSFDNIHFEYRPETIILH